MILHQVFILSLLSCVDSGLTQTVSKLEVNNSEALADGISVTHNSSSYSDNRTNNGQIGLKTDGSNNYENDSKPFAELASKADKINSENEVVRSAKLPIKEPNVTESFDTGTLEIGVTKNGSENELSKTDIIESKYARLHQEVSKILLTKSLKIEKNRVRPSNTGVGMNYSNEQFLNVSKGLNESRSTDEATTLFNTSGNFTTDLKRTVVDVLPSDGVQVKSVVNTGLTDMDINQSLSTSDMNAQEQNVISSDLKHLSGSSNLGNASINGSEPSASDTDIKATSDHINTSKSVETLIHENVMSSDLKHLSGSSNLGNASINGSEPSAFDTDIKATSDHINTSKSVETLIHESVKSSDLKHLSGSSNLGNASVNGSEPSVSDIDIKETSDHINTSKSVETLIHENVLDKNTSLNETNKLPEIKWKPGMKQPQTVHDLIKIAGADIEFIRSQFGSDFVENSSAVTISGVNGYKNESRSLHNNNITTLNDSLGMGTESGNITNNTPITEELKMTKSSVNHSTEKIEILEPGRKAANIQDNGFIKNEQLASQINITGAGSSKSNDIHVPLAKAIDGIITIQKLESHQPAHTVVRTRNPEYIHFNKMNVDTAARNSLDLSQVDFRHNGGMVRPGARQGSQARNFVGQSNMDFTHMSPPGSNARYGIPAERFVHHDRLPNIESSVRTNNNRVNQYHFQRGSSNSDQPETYASIDRNTLPARFSSSPLFLREVTDFETRRMPLEVSILPLQRMTRPDISSRHGVSRDFGKAIAPVDSTSSGMPTLDSLPFQTTGYSFDPTTLERSQGQGNQLTGTTEDNSNMSPSLDGRFLREGRQRSFTSPTTDSSIIPMPFDRRQDQNEQMNILAELDGRFLREGRQNDNYFSGSGNQRDFTNSNIFARIPTSTRFTGDSLTPGTERTRIRGFGRGHLQPQAFDGGIVPGAFGVERSVSGNTLGTNIPTQATPRFGSYVRYRFPASPLFNDIRPPMVPDFRAFGTHVLPDRTLIGHRPVDMFRRRPGASFQTF